ncbi:DUF4476 domain-containing protein [Hymenobacter sp. BT188]|uniref:DUF4476 domain-containing protein n=1 Tax=Hymenobacter sp. BT188 TaxID=2763504 RepID=UPI0016516C5E|nr:DUF4476 domain-containing protein [Hymenobacter sp. BT188]MBC6608324.1 DUF4476 domain-containing protein [Hymenobacter sp. BT188]
MKKALLLSISLLVLLSAQLRAAPVIVNFASERGVPFHLVFDGQPLTRGGVRQVSIDRLAPGFHWAEFRIPTPYGRAVNYRTRVFLDPGLETSYVLIARNGFAPALRKVAAVPLGLGRGPGRRAYPDDVIYDDDRREPNAPVDPYGAYHNGPGTAYPGAYQVMTPQDVDALAQALANRSFDSDKLLVARQALSETGIRADDLRHLLTQFDFDKDKLELAKYAYPAVADRQNFYRVYDVFRFSSSARELEAFVERNRGR